jgi:transposase
MRVVEAVGGGMARTEVARVFAVSLPTVKRWLRRRRETGELAPKPVPGSVAVKTAGLPAALPERLATRPDATLAEHCAWWRETSGHAVSRATMSRAIAALGWTRKRSR